MPLLNTKLAVETADRAIKSFFQGMLLYFGGGNVLIDAFDFAWGAAIGFGLGAAILSVVTSLASNSIFNSTATPASMLSTPSE